MRARLSLLKLAVVAFGAGLAAGGCAGAPGARARGGSAAGPSAGASDFHHTTIVGADGRVTQLTQLLAGRPALVSLWAPWCEPCVKELPQLESLAQRMAPCQVAVVGVAVGETPATVAAFARARHLSYQQFADEKFQLADALGQTHVPTTVVFDGGERVVFVGESLDGRAVAALEATLTEPAPASGCTHRVAF